MNDINAERDQSVAAVHDVCRDGLSAKDMRWGKYMQVKGEANYDSLSCVFTLPRCPRR